MDNVHAHPSPSTIVANRPRSSRGRNATSRSTSPSNRQQRLLRSRNARFPAKKLSISSISARLSHLIKTNEPNSPPQTSPQSRENTAPQRSRGSGHNSLSLPSLGILEEITNSIGGRVGRGPNRDPIPVFQDTPKRALLEGSPAASPATDHDASSAENSPLAFDHIRDSLQDMGLREISGNARKSSPLESPPLYPGGLRTGRRRKSGLKTRFNSEEYIDHIEKELLIVKEAMYSPTTNRPWKEKLKIARLENDRLRKEINEMKATFESEVQVTIERMTATEVELRRKVRSLEIDMERKDYTIQELEHQHEEKRLDQGPIDTLKATIEKLEQEKSSLEDTNHSISKRCEVLTQLLAFSPAKAQQHFDLATPVRSRKNTRPNSMMISRLPSSPSNRFPSRPQSIITSPALSATCFFSPRTAVYSPSSDKIKGDPEKLTDDEYSVDSGLGESCSVQSNADTSSRRSTIVSQTEANLSSWGLPLLSSPSTEHVAVRLPYRRRARKFLPGSTQLKPLLLPVLTGENGPLHSTSPTTSPSQNQRREISEESIDPTMAFLSRSPAPSEQEHEVWQWREEPLPLNSDGIGHLEFQTFEDILASQNVADETDQRSEQIFETTNSTEATLSPASLAQLTQVESTSFRPDCTGSNSQAACAAQTWISKLQLSSLCGALESTEKIEDDRIMEFEDLSIREYNSPLISNGSMGLHDRSSSVDIPPPLFSPAARRMTIACDTPHRWKPRPQSSSISRKRRLSGLSVGNLPNQEQSWDQAGTALIQKVSPSRLILTPLPTIQRAERSGNKSGRSFQALRSVGRSTSPLAILHQRHLGPRPLAAVTIQTIYGTLSRYTTYIRDFKRDPLALARRVIANAWRTNWAVLGKLSWWVLGLFLGPRSLNKQNSAWDWANYDGEGIADRHCRGHHVDHPEHCSERMTNSPSKARNVRVEGQQDNHQTMESRSQAKTAPSKEKPGWGESLYLWGKFSVAIMLAVTGAVVKGPAEMLRDTEVDKSGTDPSPPLRNRARSEQVPQNEPSSPAQCRHNNEFLEPTVDRCVPSGKPKRCSTGQRSYKYRRKDCLTSVSTMKELAPDYAVSSPGQTSLTTLFRFGQHKHFDFKSPSQDHDWDDTLKPPRRERQSISHAFSSPCPANREYDIESPGLGAYRSELACGTNIDESGIQSLSEHG